MTRKECIKYREQNGYWPKGYIENKRNALRFFQDAIAIMKEARPGVQIHLHHIEVGDCNYENWDTVVPMYVDEHSAIHRRKGEDYDRWYAANLEACHRRKGRPLTEEHKNALKVAWHSAARFEGCKRQAEKIRGRPLSEEHKAKLRGVRGPQKNKRLKKVQRSIVGQIASEAHYSNY